MKMDTRPAISIIIVTYNAAATLQKCLDSIYRQNYPSLKIIIIDGNSFDGTVDVIKANLTKIHYWKSEPDSGIYEAMNKALLQITGEWVYFLGADDELFDDFSNFANELEDKNAIYYANVLTNGVKRSGKLRPYQMAKHGIFHQAIIYPASLFKKNSYNTKYKIVADNVLNMQYWREGVRFIYKEYIITHFNHTGISGNKEDKEFEKDKSRLILKNYGLLIWFRFMLRTLKKQLTI